MWSNKEKPKIAIKISNKYNNKKDSTRLISHFKCIYIIFADCIYQINVSKMTYTFKRPLKLVKPCVIDISTFYIFIPLEV